MFLFCGTHVMASVIYRTSPLCASHAPCLLPRRTYSSSYNISLSTMLNGDNGKHYCILHCMRLWNFGRLDTVLCDWDEKLGRLIIFGRPSSVNAVFSLAWGVHRTRYLCLHTLQRRTETSCHDICLKTTIPPALNPARIDTFTNSLFMTNGNLL